MSQYPYGSPQQPGNYPSQPGGYPSQPGGYPPQPAGYDPQPIGYSPQYSFMPYYSATPQQLLAPARWAGWLLIVLGVIAILGGTCGGAVSYYAGDELYAEALKQVPQQQGEFQLTPQQMRLAYSIFASVAGGYGIVLIVLGLFVRGGGLISIIFSLMAMIPPAIVLLIMLIGSLTGGVLALVTFLVVMCVPIGLLITTTIFLIRAAGNTSKIANARQTMSMMYQQQMQQYYAHQQGPPQQRPGQD